MRITALVFWSWPTGKALCGLVETVHRVPHNVWDCMCMGVCVCVDDRNIHTCMTLGDAFFDQICNGQTDDFVWVVHPQTSREDHCRLHYWWWCLRHCRWVVLSCPITPSHAPHPHTLTPTQTSFWCHSCTMRLNWAAGASTSYPVTTHYLKTGQMNSVDSADPT